jgi:hypothetical protein
MVPVVHRPGALQPVFFLFFLVFSRARARTGRKPAWIKASQGFGGVNELCLFPGLLCLFPGLSAFFRVLSTVCQDFFLAEMS